MFRKKFSTICILGNALILIAFIAGCSDKNKDAINNPGNNPPVITSADSVTAVRGAPFAYQATATDADGTTPAITFENYASWLAPSGNTIAGQAALDTPDTSFMVIASDSVFADTLLVQVSMTDQGNLVSFAESIQPVLSAHCAVSGCHMGMNPAGGLRLMNYNHLMEGGLSGPVVVPFEPDSSLLIKRLEGAITPQMPMNAAPLSADTIQIFRNWILQGAQNN